VRQCLRSGLHHDECQQAAGARHLNAHVYRKARQGNPSRPEDSFRLFSGFIATDAGLGPSLETGKVFAMPPDDQQRKNQRQEKYLTLTHQKTPQN
jgi:hypothetical protein